jgi:hypothetical protein
MSLSLAICLVLAIKVRYYMAVAGLIYHIKVDVKWLCGGCRSFAARRAESNGLDELRYFGHGPGGYRNMVEDYWLWPGRSLMQAQPLFWS